jgi:hypothetical protein
MDDPVPAIPERSAAGETAAIFADIRQVLAVEVVNLIWRHLATIEGALPRAWSSLRPVYVDGTVAREAAALHAELDLPAIPKVPSEVFATLGLQADDLVAIRGILSAYNRTNAMAQIALCALMSRLKGDVESGVDDEDTPTPRAPSCPRSTTKPTQPHHPPRFAPALRWVPGLTHRRAATNQRRVPKTLRRADRQPAKMGQAGGAESR